MVGPDSSVSGDAKADLLVHNTAGQIQKLRQNITRTDGTHYFNDGPILSQGWSNFLGQSGQGRLYFADITGDGDTDLLVHNTAGQIHSRQNITRTDGTHYFNDGPILSQGWSNFLGQSGQGRLYFRRHHRRRGHRPAGAQHRPGRSSPGRTSPAPTARTTSTTDPS